MCFSHLCFISQDDRDRVFDENGVADDMLDFIYEFLESEWLFESMHGAAHDCIELYVSVCPD